MSKSVWLLTPILFLFILSCKRKPLVPKPRGYPKMELPERKTFETLNMSSCAFHFSYPNYINIEQDTLFFDEKPEEPCWLNLTYPDLNAIIFLSYKQLAKHRIEKLTEEYHRMKFEHVIKADYIDDAQITNKSKNVYGLLSDLGGEVATPFQFYLTDSNYHFVRGSLYFKTAVNPDSLAPAISFIKQDIAYIMASWEWAGR